MGCRILAVAAIVLALAGCEGGTPDVAPAALQDAAAPERSVGAGAVAMDWAGSGEAALLVPVHLNGEGPFDFVLDTGATLSCVDTQLVETLSLREVSGRTGMAAGATEVGMIRIVTIDSMRVGDARVEQLPACAIDLSAPAQMGIEFVGLLGLNFLRQFNVELDFETDELRLE